MGVTSAETVRTWPGFPVGKDFPIEKSATRMIWFTRRWFKISCKVVMMMTSIKRKFRKIHPNKILCECIVLDLVVYSHIIISLTLRSFSVCDSSCDSRMPWACKSATNASSVGARSVWVEVAEFIVDVSPAVCKCIRWHLKLNWE